MLENLMAGYVAVGYPLPCPSGHLYALTCVYLGKYSEQQLWLEISPLFVKVNLTSYKFGIPADLGTLTVLINGFFWFQFATICG